VGERSRERAVQQEVRTLEATALRGKKRRIIMGNLNELLEGILELVLEAVTAFLIDLIAGLFNTGAGVGLLG